MSAWRADSYGPSKQTSNSPQFGRSQISTRLPCAANATAGAGRAGGLLGESPPRRDDPRTALTHGFVAERQPVDPCYRHVRHLTPVAAPVLGRLRGGRAAAGNLTERYVAVDVALAGHGKHTLADHVAGHLHRPASDAPQPAA